MNCLNENRIYIASSIFIHDCFSILNEQVEESLIFITGVRLCKFLVLDKIVKFEFEHQSIGRVRGDPVSAMKALLQMDKFGHGLYATFHIHPGFGVNSTKPSCIDIKYQQSLELNRYKAIMGIFSRDGYIRFLNINNDFEFHIFGKGVERITDEGAKIYRLWEDKDFQREEYQSSKHSFSL